jgi:peptidoglycan-N-acetylglucosamine deacetylase
MHRRQFLKTAGLGAAAWAVGSELAFAADGRPQVAITMDDPRGVTACGLTPEQANRRILDALASHKVKAALFVCGMRVDNDAGRALLRSWSDAGHRLGNHSYSHWYLPGKKITLEAFCDDIARGEAVVGGYPGFEKMFRFPFFKEGDTLEKRDGVRKFLAGRGYGVIGRSTIDASDWAVDARLAARCTKQPEADLKAYRDFYLEHMWARSQYYDGLARKVLGGPVKHTVLIHYSALNALFLGDLLAMYRARGWELIDADEAYRDPVYRRQPNILPAGESLIWALAKESGKFEGQLRYPGEDDTYENPRMDELKL